MSNSRRSGCRGCLALLMQLFQADNCDTLETCKKTRNGLVGHLIRLGQIQDPRSHFFPDCTLTAL